MRRAAFLTSIPFLAILNACGSTATQTPGITPPSSTPLVTVEGVALTVSGSAVSKTVTSGTSVSCGVESVAPLALSGDTKTHNRLVLDLSTIPGNHGLIGDAVYITVYDFTGPGKYDPTRSFSEDGANGVTYTAFGGSSGPGSVTDASYFAQSGRIVVTNVSGQTIFGSVNANLIRNNGSGQQVTVSGTWSCSLSGAASPTP